MYQTCACVIHINLTPCCISTVNLTKMFARVHVLHEALVGQGNIVQLYPSHIASSSLAAIVFRLSTKLCMHMDLGLGRWIYMVFRPHGSAWCLSGPLKRLAYSRINLSLLQCWSTDAWETQNHQTFHNHFP